MCTNSRELRLTSSYNARLQSLKGGCTVFTESYPGESVSDQARLSVRNFCHFKSWYRCRTLASVWLESWFYCPMIRSEWQWGCMWLAGHRSIDDSWKDPSEVSNTSFEALCKWKWYGQNWNKRTPVVYWLIVLMEWEDSCIGKTAWRTGYFRIPTCKLLLAWTDWAPQEVWCIIFCPSPGWLRQ